MNSLTRKLLQFGAVVTICFCSISITGQEPPDGPKVLSPRTAGLIAVSFPGFEGIEPSAAEQLKAARDGLYKESTAKTTTNLRLANAFGMAGRTFHAYSIFETAVQCYKNAATLEPNDFRWRHVLGIALLELNKPYDALEAFKEATRLKPDSVPSLVNAGNTYLELDLNGLAADSFKAAFAVRPDDPAVLFGLGQVEYEKKDYRAAVGYFERVLKLVPAATRVHYQLALSYRNLKEDEKAKEHLAKQGQAGIKVSDPLVTSIEQLRKGIRSKLTEAKTAMDARQFEAAANIYAEVLKSEPENIIALANIGAAYLQLGKAAEAVAVFERVLELEPENTNAYYNLGVIYSVANKPFQAISNFKSLLKYQPNDHDARFRLARELRKANLLNESLAEYKLVVEKQPESENAFLDLISLMDAKGMHKDLLVLLKQAREQFPSRGQTAAAYAYALATTPLLELREGEKAFALATEVFEASDAIEHGIVVSFALSEMGQCADAKKLVRVLSDRAAKEKRDDLLPKLATEAKRLENPGGCRP